MQKNLFSLYLFEFKQVRVLLKSGLAELRKSDVRNSCDDLTKTRNFFANGEKQAEDTMAE
jgi:hypothetical protein